MNLNRRPMTPNSELFLSLLRENAHVTTEQARGAGVKGVVDAVAVLLDNDIKVRADFHRAGNCIRYRLEAPDAGRDIASVLGPRSEVKDAARKGIGKSVWEVMKDGNWRTPKEVGRIVNISPARASSAFRRFGYSDRVRFKVEKRKCQQEGIKYEYRISRIDATSGVVSETAPGEDPQGARPSGDWERKMESDGVVDARGVRPAQWRVRSRPLPSGMEEHLAYLGRRLSRQVCEPTQEAGDGRSDRTHRDPDPQ